MCYFSLWYFNRIVHGLSGSRVDTKDEMAKVLGYDGLEISESIRVINIC